VKGMSNHATSIKAAKIQLKTEAGIKSFWLSRDTGHSCNTQHTVKWALCRLSLRLHTKSSKIGRREAAQRTLLPFRAFRNPVRFGIHQLYVKTKKLALLEVNL
jgi:hypothetical protein